MLRRPSVVRPSSVIFSETAGPIVLILHIYHLQVGRKNNCVFCFDRIRTLVAMVTYAYHILIMQKSKNCQFLLSCWRYLNFVFAEMFIENKINLLDPLEAVKNIQREKVGHIVQFRVMNLHQ